MKIIGLTGGIAMGKSVVAAMLLRMKVPLHDADQAAHRLLRRGSPVFEQLQKKFPSAADDEGMNRQKLGALVFHDQQAKKELEAILHPAIRQQSQAWVKQMRRQRRRAVVMDIPLLFETGRDAEMDFIISVFAAKIIQRQRALRRKGMNEAKFKAICAAQTSPLRRKIGSDALLVTGLGRGVTWRGLARLLRQAMSKEPRRHGRVRPHHNKGTG